MATNTGQAILIFISHLLVLFGIFILYTAYKMSFRIVMASISGELLQIRVIYEKRKPGS